MHTGKIVGHGTGPYSIKDEGQRERPNYVFAAERTPLKVVTLNGELVGGRDHRTAARPISQLLRKPLK